MLFPLALIPMLLFSSPWRHDPVRSQLHHIGPWTVQVTTDRFSDRLTCRLFARDMDYQRGALVIRLPRRIDTSTAVYRVDDGAPVAVRDELMAMARLGFAVYRDDLANPSGGVVRISDARLVDAHAVSIQAGPKGAVIRFKVGGFGAALDVARAAGCTPGAFTRPGG